MAPLTCSTCAHNKEEDAEECLGCPFIDGALSNYTPAATNAALKFDQEKPRMDLVPTEAVQALAKVLTFGAKKYSSRNWEKGMDWSRAYAALQRHLLAWWGGESLDTETGYSHLDHALTELAFLVAYEQRGVGLDDREGTIKNLIKEQAQ
mgnify:CR=1 FL=1